MLKFIFTVQFIAFNDIFLVIGLGTANTTIGQLFKNLKHQMNPDFRI